MCIRFPGRLLDPCSNVGVTLGLDPVSSPLLQDRSNLGEFTTSQLFQRDGKEVGGGDLLT